MKIPLQEREFAERKRETNVESKELFEKRMDLLRYGVVFRYDRYGGGTRGAKASFSLFFRFANRLDNRYRRYHDRYGAWEYYRR